MSPTKRMLAPRYWGYHLLALVLTLVAFGFGVWQLDSWQQQREVDAIDPATLTPVPLEEALGPDQAFPGDLVGQPVMVEGTWLPESTVLIEERTGEAKGGVWVVTPLAVGSPDAPALMIVRGWTRDVDDIPPAPTGEAELVVNLQPSEGTGAVDDDPTDNVLPQLRIADALNHVDRDLYGAYGVVTTDLDEQGWPVGDDAVNAGTEALEAAALDQLPEGKRSSSGLRNFLYGIEWFVFGLFVVYIWWRWVRDEVERQEESHVTDGDDPAPDATAG